VRELSAEYGIEICAYGSYYRAGDDLEEFMRSLETAEELGAPVMRIWCGRRGSDQADAEYRQSICENLRSICGIAAERGIDIALEFHSGTLTDDIESVRRLMAETEDIENLRFYWQPRWDWTEEERLEALKLVLPRIAYVHTFTWMHTPDIVRLELEKGAEMWKKALAVMKDGYALIEFVMNDSDEALLDDAAALNGWISEI
jgi:sugar phosphate isomerase/epimerase